MVINNSSLGQVKWEETVFWGIRSMYAMSRPLILRHLPAIVDPHEPPMSPKVTVDPAVNCAESLARAGRPNRRKIAQQ